MAPVESGGVPMPGLPSVTLSPAAMPGWLSELKSATAGPSGEAAWLVRGALVALAGADELDRRPPRKICAPVTLVVPSEGNWPAGMTVNGAPPGCGEG